MQTFIFIATLEKQNYAARSHGERERERERGRGLAMAKAACAAEKVVAASQKATPLPVRGMQACIFIARGQRGKEEKLFLHSCKAEGDVRPAFASG